MTEQVNGSAAPLESSQNTTPEQSNSNVFDVSKYFSDDLRQDPDFERLAKNIPNDPAKLVKDLYHKTKFFGRAKDEVRKELEAELSKPQIFQADQYTYEMPEGYNIEEELTATAKQKAMELGIKPEQFKGLMEEMFKADHALTSKQELQAKEANDAAIESLKNEWGSNYDKKMEEANRMWQFLTSPEEDAILDKMDATAKVAISKIMSKIAAKTSETPIGKLNPVASKDAIQAEIARIQQDKAHPYHRGDPSAVQQMFDLQKRLIR